MSNPCNPEIPYSGTCDEALDQDIVVPEGHDVVETIIDGQVFWQLVPEVPEVNTAYLVQQGGGRLLIDEFTYLIIE